MQTTIVKCNCDSCNNEMSEYEYLIAPTITLRIDMPNPKGGCGQVGAERMTLCEECLKKLGLTNDEKYHGYNYSQSKLTNDMSKSKNKFLELFFKRK